MLRHTGAPLVARRGMERVQNGGGGYFSPLGGFFENLF